MNSHYGWYKKSVWSEKRYGIDVPNNHQAGLRGDNTLVGQLDTGMNRTAPSRNNGSGVWFPPMLQGKFSYLNNNDLKDSLVNRHQGRGWSNAAAGQALPNGNFTASGITSTDDGATVTWKWICDQIKAGEDVELIFSYDDANGNPTGGHAVRVFGCGKTLGLPWIKYLHDGAQSNDSFGLETVHVFTTDTDGDGMVNLGVNGREIRFSMSESVTEAAKNAPTSPAQVIGEALVNAAGFVGKVLTKGAIATVFGLFNEVLGGNNLQVAALFSEGAANQDVVLPTTLNGATVLIDGRAAPLYFVGPGQINFQVPDQTELGPASVVIMVNDRPSDIVTVVIGEAGPGIFTLDPSVAGDNRAAVQNFPDFSLNLPNNPVEPGSFVIVYGTGLGAVTNPVPAGELTPQDPLSEVVEPVTTTIGGMEATVVFAGLAPNFAGLMQVNIEVPQLPLGEHEIVLTADGIQSNAALVSIGSN